MYDDFLARIVEPDVFLPSQFFAAGGLSRHLEGEKRLMIAILKDAVECLNKYRDSRSSSRRSQYQNALEWVEDKGTGWLFSFNNICDHLGYDPDYFRQVVLKKQGKYSNSGRGKIYSFPIMPEQI